MVDSTGRRVRRFCWLWHRSHVRCCGGVGWRVALGPRQGKYGPNGEINAIQGSNMPLATLGMFILGFGWFGFNGGSELKLSNIDEANAVAQVFVNTNMAAAGGLIAALVVARLMFGKADLTMALNGVLVWFPTAEPLSGTNVESMLIGAVAVYWWCCRLLASTRCGLMIR